MKYVEFYGNLYKCPFGRRLPNCPVYLVNPLSFEEKFNWFENLSGTEKEAIVAHHSQCARMRAEYRVLV